MMVLLVPLVEVIFEVVVHHATVIGSVIIMVLMAIPSHCWHKHGKPDYIHQVTNAVSSSQQVSTSSDHVAPLYDFGALNTHLSELSDLVQSLRATLPSSSNATLASSGNIACAAHSCQPWILDSGSSSHMSGKRLFAIIYILLHTVLFLLMSPLILLVGRVLFDPPSLSRYPLIFVFLIFLLICFPSVT